MSGSTGPLIPRRRIGAEFRRLREERGEQLKDTAAALVISASKLSRIETGQAEPRPRDLKYLLDYFAITGTPLSDEITRWTVQARARPWWVSQKFTMPARLEAYLSYESAATRIEEYEPNFIPGPLQTEEYARRVVSAVVPGLSASEADHQARLRRARREFLDSRDNPIQLVVAFPEEVLRRSLGDEQIRRGQLAALLTDCEDPRFEIHVLTDAAGIYPALDGGPFTIFHYADDRDLTTVALASVTGTEFSHERAVVDDCSERFFDLHRRWLSPTDSRTFIESARNSIPSNR